MSQPNCLGNHPAPTVLRPPWCDKGTVIVTDPKYGEVSLISQPKPLRCWKSALLPDGTAWMWRSDAWHDNPFTPTSGLLFFAPTWEYWQMMGFVSQKMDTLLSIWEGPTGTGRILQQQVTVQCVFGQPQATVGLR